MSLTTPVLNESDDVLSTDGWFYYWKTSFSLWEEKIKSFSGTKIFIPINWSFHSETGDEYDFGKIKPETDLARLISLIRKQNKIAILFVPVGPVPFLPNGGIPYLTARSFSQNKDSTIKHVLGDKKEINKIFSFFDNRIFRSYTKFVNTLGKYISINGIDSDVYGLSCYDIQDGQISDFFSDFSKTYQQGFVNYVEAKREEGDDYFDKGPSAELKAHHDFFQMIKNLYQTKAEEKLSPNWEGIYKMSFLGGNQEDYINRVCGHEYVDNYIDDILSSLTYDVFPSLSLLPTKLKDDRFFSKSYAGSILGVVQGYFDKEIYQNQGSISLSAIKFFEIYENDFINPEQYSHWGNLSFWTYIEQNYKWCYSRKKNQKFSWSEEDIEDDLDKVRLFYGAHLDEAEFQDILRCFMSGGRIMLNTSLLEEKFKRRLEVFILENSLEVESLNFMTSIRCICLGEGKLVLFDGEGLGGADRKEQMLFWDRIIKTFKINHQFIECEDGVEAVWFRRSVSQSELNFEEMRRVLFFNPTSYKRKMKFQLNKNFALVKVVDPINSDIRSGQEIEISLEPNGTIGLDIGVFS